MSLFRRITNTHKIDVNKPWLENKKCTHTKHVCLFSCTSHSHTHTLLWHAAIFSFAFLWTHNHTHSADTTRAALHSPTILCKLQINPPWAWLELMCLLCSSGTNMCVWINEKCLCSLFPDSREKKPQHNFMSSISVFSHTWNIFFTII